MYIYLFSFFAMSYLCVGVLLIGLLSCSVLSMVYLRGAFLRIAYLWVVFMCCAVLRGAYVGDADFSGVNLDTTTVVNANFSQAQNVNMPDYKKGWH